MVQNGADGRSLCDTLAWKGTASSGQRVSCNDVPLVMRLLTREWHALGERSMDDPEYEEAIKACL